jgi:DNA-binding transcriptional MerR regulator
MNQYPIRTIAELTGIPSTTLRAWERRYGLLKPARTPKGHRLYSSEDIELIRKISNLLKHNHSISEAIRMVRNPDQAGLLPPLQGENHWRGFQQQLLNAIEVFNDQNLDKVYNDALAIYPIDRVTEQVIIPVMKILGERWRERDAGIAEEHFFSAFLRNKLGARFHHDTHRSRGRRILVACLPDEYHELGVLLYCIAAIGRGYRILYLGTDTPLEQIPPVVERSQVAAVLLSGSRRDDWDDRLASALDRCIQRLDIPVMLGGELSEYYADNIRQLDASPLGTDHVRALDAMESIIPAFARL